MHLLRTQPGGFVPDDSIADLGQTPADLVILCSGDSHLALLAETAQQLPDDYPSLRLANPMQVQNHASVDLYVDEVLRHAEAPLLVTASTTDVLAQQLPRIRHKSAAVSVQTGADPDATLDLARDFIRRHAKAAAPVPSGRG